MQYETAREQLLSPPAKISWWSLVTEATVLIALAFGSAMILGI